MSTPYERNEVLAFTTGIPPCQSTQVNVATRTCSSTSRRRRSLHHIRKLAADNTDGSTNKTTGDTLRASTGIRPSLHPITINCVAEALLLRSRSRLGKKQENGDPITIDTSDSSVEALQVAITAGGIAVNAIDQRNKSADADGDGENAVLDTSEQQTVSGRVVGVVMRLPELESLLVDKVKGVGWVSKYGEEESFGLLRSEVKDSEGDSGQLAEQLQLNPLLRMNRAECLLALFIDTVEKPQLERIGQRVPDSSRVDFIDADRLEVLVAED